MSPADLFHLDEAASHYVTAGDARFHILEWAGESPPMVLLHPNRTNARVWDFFVSHCSTHHRVLAPELRGHGRSSWDATKWSIDSHLTDMVRVLEELDLGPSLLVGAATGGNLALLVASEFPHLASAIVVVDPGLSLDRALSASVQRQIAEEFEYDSLQNARNRLPFSERWTDQMKDHFTFHSFALTETGRYRWRYSTDAARRTEASLEDPIWDRIDVECPTLIVRGAESPAFTPDRLRQLVQVVHHAEFVEIEGAGHRVPQDAPEQLATVVMSFATQAVPGFAVRNRAV
jgi:lipase